MVDEVGDGRQLILWSAQWRGSAQVRVVGVSGHRIPVHTAGLSHEIRSWICEASILFSDPRCIDGVGNSSF